MSDRVSEFRNLLKTSVLVSDGAMGTMLQQSGLQAGECAEEWNVTHPEIIRGIHQAYFDAGADIVETNTFGGNRSRLALHGQGDRVSELNRAAVELAKSARPPGKFIAGSVGPSGEFLEPMGTVTEKTLYDLFREQITVLLSAGVDLILIETMSDVHEVQAAARATRDLDREIPFILSMTFEKSLSGFYTMMGISPEEVIRVLEELKPDALGANCGDGAPEMIELMRIFRDHSTLPLLAQANAGKPILEGNAYFYKESPTQRGEFAQQFLDLGVRIIGGCCGTTPQHISSIRAAVDKNYPLSDL